MLIEASAADAEHLAVNSVCLGEHLIACHASDALREVLTGRGYELHVVPLGSFNRSGGSAYCLTLRLDLSSRSEAGDPGRRRAGAGLGCCGPRRTQHPGRGLAPVGARLPPWLAR